LGPAAGGVALGGFFADRPTPMAGLAFVRRESRGHGFTPGLWMQVG
jgi:orotate phosphoribosyltransferase